VTFANGPCLQEVCAWIRNNWRSKNTVHTEISSRKKSKLDIVWRDKQNEVLEEVKLLHAEAGGEGDPTHQDKFRFRTPAAKKVFTRMSEDEKRIIEREVEKLGQEVNPPEIQQK